MRKRGSSGPRARSGEPRRGAVVTGGWVARQEVKTSMPVSSRAAPARVPASGKTALQRKAARTGPSMKHSSSAACSKDIAVWCEAGESRSRWVQRARDMPPMLGVVAVAAYAAKRVHAGAPVRTQTIRAREPRTAIRVAGTAIRAWPWRSISLAVQGATSAVAARPVAVTAPARAYEPRWPAIIMTALTANMPMGSRASRFPAVNPRAPGRANSRRYGPWGVRAAREDRTGRTGRAGAGAAARTRVLPVTVIRGARAAVVVVAGMGKASGPAPVPVQHLFRGHSPGSVVSLRG